MRDMPRMSRAARPTCWTANGCGLCIAMGCWPPPFVQPETLACCAAMCGIDVDRIRVLTRAAHAKGANANEFEIAVCPFRYHGGDGDENHSGDRGRRT